MDNRERPILVRARRAQALLASSAASRRSAALRLAAAHLQRAQGRILAANRRDVRRLGQSHPFLDRLLLTPDRISGMVNQLRTVSRLADVLGETIEDRRVPSGLHLRRVRVPIGVIAVVYESRPNVTVEVAALTVKSGNAVILRGGHESEASNRALVSLLRDALRRAGLPADAVMFLDPRDRRDVRELLTAEEDVDLIIPRGGHSLIRFVRQHATVPVIETGAGVCHTYVERSAHLRRAADVVVNAKVQRPTVCNALDTLVLDASIAGRFLPLISPRLAQSGVVVFADSPSLAVLRSTHPAELLRRATPEHFGHEFLSLKMSIKTVRGFREGLRFIQTHTSGHSEAILTNNRRLAQAFLDLVDAAAVYWNTSTRFTDGYEFGLGAEVGISTQKLHARGPLGVRELTSYKWVIESNWATRR